MPGGATPETAVDMTTFPFTDSAVPTVDNQEYWYRYEATARGGISVFAGRDDTTIDPGVTAYLEDLTVVHTVTYARVLTVPITVPGTVYLFLVQSPITAGTATLHWEARVALGLPPDLSGYIFIPTDSSAGTGGAAVIDPTTGAIVGLFGGFPPGERGAAIGTPINRLIVPDKRDRSIVWIYSTVDLTVLLGPLSGALIAGTQGQSDPPMAASVDTFYVGQRRADLSVYRITAVDPLTGTIGTTWDLPMPADLFLYAMTVTADNTIAYYTVDDANTPIRAWDLVSDVALPNLAAAISGDQPLDVIVLADGTVVASRVGSNYYLVRYSAAGAVLHTYDPLSLPGYGSYFIDHIDRDIDPANFWVWLQGTDPTQAFIKYRASDGAVLAQIAASAFTDGRTGKVVVPPGAMPTDWFGLADSCPLMLVPPVGVVPVNTLIGAVGSYAIGGGSGGGGGGLPTPPPPATLIYSAAPPDFGLQTVPMRRLRRAPHLADEQRWLTYDRFQLDLQTGVGLVSGQGSDPQIMLRWSNDGGHTWSNEHWVSAGRMGATKTRAIWRQLGRARTRTFEVVVSDQVRWFLAAAYIDVSPGDS